MQPALDRNTLDRLVALGRANGHLTSADLRDSLPVETMSADDIALIVVHLEESGIPVELEESLLFPHAGARPTAPSGAEIIPFPHRPAAEPKPAPPLSPSLEGVGAIDPPPRERRTAPNVHWTVAGAGVLALAVLWLLSLAW